MEDREIFFFEDSRGIKQREKEEEEEETSTKLSEENVEKATNVPSDSSTFVVTKRILPSFLPTNFYTLYIWS